MTDKTPIKPGYYWAQWRIPADGTFEGEEICPSSIWEIVQVNSNHVDWENDPLEDEALSVLVTGVRETQWRDCFVWGDFVAALNLFADANDGASRFTDQASALREAMKEKK